MGVKRGSIETCFRDKLAQGLQREVEMEACTRSGYIDILIPRKALIEVKRMRDWKIAIGQIISYGDHHPRLK